MGVASILGVGVTGLGFLLAWFAYRLLANNRTSERPIYVYMGFCLALVIIGAGLQYNGNQQKGLYDYSMREKQALENISKNSDSVITSLHRVPQESINGCNGRGGGVLDIASQAASAISGLKATADAATSAP